MELSVTDKICEIIFDILAIIANRFSADEEEIIKDIVFNNEKCMQIFEMGLLIMQPNK